MFDRRSGDVAQLGVDPSGEHTLFDDGRELRVLSLTTKKIEGTLQNASTTAAFATLALYSPDGNTILTNGNAAGRLQLWRAPTANDAAGRAAPVRLEQRQRHLRPPSRPTASWSSPARRTIACWSGRCPRRPRRRRAQAGQLTYVEEFLDTSLKRVTVRATLNNPGGTIIPGSSATIVVPPLGRVRAVIGRFPKPRGCNPWALCARLCG